MAGSVALNPTENHSLMFAELIDGVDILLWKSVRGMFNNPAQLMMLNTHSIIMLQQAQFCMYSWVYVFVCAYLLLCVCMTVCERVCVFVSEMLCLHLSFCLCVCVWERENGSWNKSQQVHGHSCTKATQYNTINADLWINYKSQLV